MEEDSATRGVPAIRPFARADLIDESYRLEEKVSEGGMGVVWRATDVKLGRPVALKFVLGEADESVLRRFAAEAKSLASIQSPHVALVYRSGLTRPVGGFPYIAMEWLAGKDLGQELAERTRLPTAEIVGYTLQLCEGLAALHDARIVHRDVKPSNIFLVDGPRGRTVKLVDLGIARRLETHSTRLTHERNIIGTPAYMSPEQIADGLNVDTRSDIWSVGVVLFEALSGELPLFGAGQLSLMHIPSPLRPIIARCLTPRDLRFNTVDELRSALCDALARIEKANQLPNHIAIAATLPFPTDPSSMPPVPPAIIHHPPLTGPVPQPPRSQPSARKALVPFAASILVAGAAAVAYHLFPLPPRACKEADLIDCTTQCNRGNAESCTALGHLYEEGQGVTRDDAHAVALYKQACDRGEARGCQNLGLMYWRGRGVFKPDGVQAVAAFKQACAQGSVIGCVNLGAMYYHKSHGDHDAISLFKNACDNGTARGCLWLGAMYETGSGGLTIDGVRAVALYEQACRSGDATGCYALGLEHIGGVGGLTKDEAKAVTLFKQACAKGEAEACLVLGFAFYTGELGLRQDRAQAASLIEKACDMDKGYPSPLDDWRGHSACLVAANMYAGALPHAPSGLPKDEGQAASFYKRACANGDAAGCTALAGIYELGAAGLPKDEPQAVALYKQACDQEEAEGCVKLAAMYERGAGSLANDESQAIALYQRACDQFYSPACARLGAMYEQGIGGLAKDLGRAAALYERACSKDAPESCTRLGGMYERGTGGLTMNESKARDFYSAGCLTHGNNDAQACPKLIGLEQRACNRGVGANCADLGKYYENGEAGLAKDEAHAASFYKRACALHVNYGCERLEASRTIPHPQ
jgi:uncharacterized protein